MSPTTRPTFGTSGARWSGDHEDPVVHLDGGRPARVAGSVSLIWQGGRPAAAGPGCAAPGEDCAVLMTWLRATWPRTPAASAPGHASRIGMAAVSCDRQPAGSWCRVTNLATSPGAVRRAYHEELGPGQRSALLSWLAFTGTFAGLWALTSSIRAGKGPFSEHQRRRRTPASLHMGHRPAVWRRRSRRPRRGAAPPLPSGRRRLRRRTGAD